jgi:MoxR-like ATPase
MAKTIGCDSKRIQFTADLLPTDITGFVAYSRTKGFFVVKGPIFTNFVLADEINRAPPKVQSALIEVMQEKQVTIGKKTYHLERPFIIFATENPLENRGVYKLPEAQVDRFLFKVIVDYPQQDEEEQIMDQNITLKKFEDYKIKTVASPKDIIKIQELVKKVYVHPKIKKYITEIVNYTRPSDTNDLKSIKFVEWGASPRASINIYLAARARALMLGRSYVVPHDVKEVTYNVLRHRVLLNYHGQVENVKSEDIITEILNKVKVP